MKERRKDKRFCLFFSLRGIILPERKNIFYTVGKDLSLKGIKILCEDFLSFKRIVRININLIDETAEMTAQVVWCNKRPYSERYYAGLEFLEVSEKDKCKLGHFIEKNYSLAI